MSAMKMQLYYIEYFTGVQVSRSTHQRLVHRQSFDLPHQEDTVEELSVDGGNIRVRTQQGEVCAWHTRKNNLNKSFLRDLS